MKTEELIEHLADRLEPVRPLGRPGLRALVWLSGAFAFLVVLALSMTSDVDLAINGTGMAFVAPQVLAVITGILAAWTAFRSVIPGYSPTLLIWTMASALAWTLSLALGTRQDQIGGMLVAPREWMCVAIIILGGTPLGTALWAMLRRGAPLHPGVTAALAALAVGALANVAACVSHPHTNNGITLVWHGATITVLVGLAAAAGRLRVKWPSAA